MNKNHILQLKIHFYKLNKTMLPNLIYNLKQAFTFTFLKPFRRERASRAEFWYSGVWIFVLLFVVYLCMDYIVILTEYFNYKATQKGGIKDILALLIWTMMFVYPYTCICMLLKRRLADFGIYGWAVFFIFIILAGLIPVAYPYLTEATLLYFYTIISILGFQKGKVRSNRYGSDSTQEGYFRTLR
ncbi:MAG: DUF805 domain-containing protein [Alphaproteobacteria bacterium]|nr:DUF805 domain-containing protein [Alphaproteobacteria bacterium]